MASLSLAASTAPKDPDLLSLKASIHQILGEDAEAESDLDSALRVAPDHVEATMLRAHGTEWGGPLYLSPWSDSERSLHPIMAAKWNRGEIMQPVSDSMAAALAFIQIDDTGLYDGKVSRYRWTVVNSKTPHGPLMAHYALIEIDGKVRRRESIVSAAVDRSSLSMDPMIVRFPGVRNCFLIVAKPNGDIVQNLRYKLPGQTRKELRITAKALASTVTTSHAVRAATDWHMERFDMNQLSLDE